MNFLALLHLWILFSFFLRKISLVALRGQIFFKHQRTVMYQKEEISLLENKLRAVQMPPGFFRWCLLLYAAVSAHLVVAFSSLFQDFVKKWSTVHSHKLLWIYRFLSLPLTSPFLPPPFSPAAFVQPDNPLLNPREHIFGTGTIKKKETNWFAFLIWKIHLQNLVQF